MSIFNASANNIDIKRKHKYLEQYNLQHIANKSHAIVFDISSESDDDSNAYLKSVNDTDYYNEYGSDSVGGSDYEDEDDSVGGSYNDDKYESVSGSDNEDDIKEYYNVTQNNTRKRKPQHQLTQQTQAKKHKGNTCIEDGCNIHASCNYETETKPLYCATHKKENMINIVNKKCIEDGCNILPCFNYETETKSLYCATHKKENMVDVINKKCIEEGCNIIASYNYETESKRLYCATHKKDNMVDVKKKMY